MTQAFDQQELLDELDDDVEFLEESLEILDQDAPKLLGQIREGVQSADASAVAVAAHTLKSMVGNFAAQPAFEAALAMEQVGRGGDLSTAGKVFQELEEKVAGLQTALHQFLDHYK